MDVLPSQAAIAGHAAVLEGARWLGAVLPMLTTVAGVIRPTKTIALGAGVAGRAIRLTPPPPDSACPWVPDRFRI